MSERNTVVEGQEYKAEEARSLREEVFRKICKREIKRFHRAVNESIRDLLSQRFDQAEGHEEFQRYVDLCTTVKNILRMIDPLIEKLPSLFAITGERSNWDIYLSGLAKLNRQLPESHLFGSLLSAYRLDELQEKLFAFSGRWLDYLSEAHKVLGQLDEYLDNTIKGREVMENFKTENEELLRTYASLKSWETEEDLDQFFDDLADFLESSIEVFISGPLQLYLMIGRDTFLLIFKALTVRKIGELTGDERQYVELMALHDFVYDLIEKSETLGIFQEVLERSGERYTELLKEEHLRLRGQIPGKHRKRRFIEHFESGALFKEEKRTSS
ncbi:MAG TPA: hypothetical protein EYP53_05750 [Candidatus Latescibacteria bacterium]|nr:hypothetical protein [Candidatus Latescibacterota bacterium]